MEALSDEQLPVIRPANYPEGNPGRGYLAVSSPRGFTICVGNLQGRSFMNAIDCPFKKADEMVTEFRKETMFSILDFHGETTAEKQTIGRYLDGKVSAVVGTHTHVQTADERIFPQGTGYITDVGMTGPFDSVIGMKTDIALKRFLYQVPEYYAVASNDIRMNAVMLNIDLKNGKTKKIKRLNVSKADYGKQ
jgi:metallophosphoesterase (TIGR00282 family)